MKLKRWLVVLCAGLLGRAGFAQQPVPTLTQVRIVSPLGTPANPFRTNRDLLSVKFTSDAAGGVFFATTKGADIPMMTFLANTSEGEVGIGLLKNGPHNVQVLLSTANTGLTTQVQALSDPVTIVLDTTPPSLTVSQIQLRPGEGFQPFDPQKNYTTNAKQIALTGTVSDGANGVPNSQITIATTGTQTPGTATADASGRWELTVDLSKEADGPLSLAVVANDNVAGTRNGNRTRIPVPVR